MSFSLKKKKLRQSDKRQYLPHIKDIFRNPTGAEYEKDRNNIH
jgi:hypothetical protein